MADTSPRTTLRRTTRHLSRLAAPLALAAVVTASASGYAVIHIRSGDTVSALAARYHTTVAAIVALNHLPGNGDLIYAGQTLRVPTRVTTKAPAATSTTRLSTYVVHPGDSLDAIAARFHESPHVLAVRNRLPRSLVVRIGQRMLVTVHVRTRAAAQQPALFVAPVVGRDRSRLAASWQPPRSAVKGLVRRTAQAWGVDPALALAVSWQESGFNQRMVSPTDALGAMQVEPYTGAFVSTYVVHRHLDLFRAEDNVTAGVALLDTLLQATGGNAPLAIAGYYQGLASVRAHGMLPDTKQYVASVLALRASFR